jgi:Flp pilus assembly protein TadG
VENEGTQGRVPYNSQSGNSLIMVVLFITVIFGFVALSLDVGNVMREQRKAQTATDAAAMAAALLLPTNQPGQVAVKAQALAFANANGVSTNEVRASGPNNTGTIQLGYWRTSDGNYTLVPSLNFAGIYTAVKVPAARTVPLYFGNVVGLGAMKPATHSIAVNPGRPPPPAPVGFTGDQFTNLNYWSYVYLGPGNGQGSGKWGTLNLGYIKNPYSPYPNKAAWQTDMAVQNIGGVSVVKGCATCVIDSYPTSIPVFTGFANITDAFNAIPLGSVFTVAVAGTDFPGNSGSATIIGFVYAQLVSYCECGGANWTATIQIVDPAELGLGNQFGGTTGWNISGGCPPPCVQPDGQRVMVE